MPDTTPPEPATLSFAEPGPPISLELSPQDAAQVDAAVRWLNQTVRASGLELAVEVKRYVLTEFFEGDYARFADPSRAKPLSFSALCARQDLEIGEKTLYRMIRVGWQVEQLPPGVGAGLSMRHHRALLPVTDDAVRAELARRAEAEAWTSDDLERAVREQQPPARTGRKPLPVVVKQARELGRTWSALEAAGEPEKLVVGLAPAQLDELEGLLAQGEARMARLRAAVQTARARG